MHHALRAAVAIGVSCLTTACHASPRTVAATDAASPLRLERKIVLPDVAGRIDHLAIDPAHHRLFVAEYGNGTVDEVDLDAGKVVGRIGGLREPQGIAALVDGQIVVACGDGSVHFYAASDRREIAKLTLGDDADNVRIDARNGHVIVGYGAGGLAVIDPTTHRILARLLLAGHPEGFRLTGSIAVINIPDRGAIVAADLDAGRVTATWRTGVHRLNFPLALDPAGRSFAIAYRLPAMVEVRDIDSGAVISTRPACGDADDIFSAGKHFLLVCGAGHVDRLPITAGKAEAVRVATAPGARTGLFVPELKTLFVAAPSRGGGSAAIWVLRAD